MANQDFLGLTAEVYLTLALLFWLLHAPPLGLGSRALERRSALACLSHDQTPLHQSSAGSAATAALDDRRRSAFQRKRYPNGFHALRGVDLRSGRGEVVVESWGHRARKKHLHSAPSMPFEEFQEDRSRSTDTALSNDLRNIDLIACEKPHGLPSSLQPVSPLTVLAEPLP